MCWFARYSVETLPETVERTGTALSVPEVMKTRSPHQDFGRNDVRWLDCKRAGETRSRLEHDDIMLGELVIRDHMNRASENPNSDRHPSLISAQECYLQV